MKAVILAGGVGKRLWPISNQDCPKQFLNLLDQKSLLQKTIERFDYLDIVDHILISTSIHYKELLEEKKPVSKKPLSFLYEPTPRNTGPAIMLSAKYLEEVLRTSPDEPILILPSDHVIEPIEEFFEVLKAVSKELDGITTFGIRPKRAETGYGYIQVKNTSGLVKPIVQFIEKPPKKVAKTIYNKEDYFWNSGMFLFNSKILKDAVREYNKDLYEIFDQSYENCLRNFSNAESISFDHAIMEKVNNSFCVSLDVAWSDIGSWDSLYDILDKDNNQNVKVGNIVDLDTKNSLIIGQKKLVSTMGIDNIICIETDDTIFLAKKGKSQDLKRLLDLIRIKNH